MNFATHKRNLLIVLLAGTLILAFLGNWAESNSPTEATPSSEVTRKVLLKRELTGFTDREGQIIKVEVPPNSTTGLHSHPIDEFIYVLEGSGHLEIKDQPEPITVKPGETLMMPTNQIHEMKNVSASEPLRFLQFSVPIIGQPLAIPVPQH